MRAAWDFVARAIRPAEMIWNLIFQPTPKIALRAMCGPDGPRHICIPIFSHDPRLCGKKFYDERIG